MKRRYLTAQSRLWRLASMPLALLGVVLMGGFTVMWMDDAHATIWNLAPASIFSLLFFLPGVVALYRTEFIEVDLSARTAVFRSKRKAVWDCPLDELGPIGFKQGHRASKESGRTGTTYFHVMCRGAKQVAIRETYTYEAARRYATKVATEWNVGLLTMDGQFHPASQIQQPLRAHKSGTAPAPKLTEASGVVIENEPGRTVIRSKNKLRAQEFPNVLLLGGVVMGFFALVDLHAASIIESPFDDPGQTFLAIAAALLLSICGGAFLMQLWRFLAPSTTITIDGRSVRYRGMSINLEDIREVTYTTGPAILSARKKIEIDPAFCHASEIPAFIPELRRLVVEAGNRLPQQPSV